MKRALTFVAVPALAISLAACGDNDSGDAKAPMAGHSMAASASPSNRGSQAQHNDQDVMFAQMMVPHHRQAIEMADLAATRTASPEVKQLAAEIKKGQDPEIKQLSAWLTAWGASMAFAPIPRGSALPRPTQPDGLSNDAAGFASCYGPHRRSP